METITIAELRKQVAARLTGRPVDVRNQPPAIKGRAGQAHTMNGRAVVDIDPGLSEADHLFIFLHELGHVVAHRGELPSHMGAWAPQSKILTPLGKHPAIEKQESEANALAARWLDYADANYRRYGNDSMPATWRKLLALRDYTDQEELKAWKSRVLSEADAFRAKKTKPDPWANYP